MTRRYSSFILAHVDYYVWRQYYLSNGEGSVPMQVKRHILSIERSVFLGDPIRTSIFVKDLFWFTIQITKRFQVSETHMIM